LAILRWVTLVTQVQQQHQLLFPAAQSNAYHYRLAFYAASQASQKVTLNLRNYVTGCNNGYADPPDKLFWGLIRLAELNGIWSHVGVTCGCELLQSCGYVRD